MKTHVFSVLVSICAFCMLLASCGGNKQVVQSERRYTNPFEGGAFDVPCAVYDDDEYFAATGFARGSFARQGELQRLALSNGQEMVAQKIRHAVQGQITSYFESTGSNEATDIDANTESKIVSDIMTIVNNTSHCCLKFSGVDEKGNTTCYIGIKVEKQVIADAVTENLSQSKKDDIRRRSDEFAPHLTKGLKEYREE